MRKCKGVTLMSIIIYITVLFVVMAVTIRIMSHFRSNMNDVADVTFETEFEKFNMYMLEELNRNENYVVNYSASMIEFSNGNVFSFSDEDNDGIGEIYFNNIKLCKKINACVFSVVDDLAESKTTITVNITINDISKEEQYIMSTLKDTVRLPAEYQEIEYIGSSGTQYINTGIISSADKIEQYAEIQVSRLSKRQLTGQNYGWWFGVTSSNYYEGAGTTTIMPSEDDFDTIVFTSDYEASTKKMNINGTEFNQSTTFDPTGLWKAIYIFNINNYSNASMTAKIKSFKIIVNDELVRNFVPCYRKNDDIAGLYDMVNNEFYTNAGTGEFSRGQNVYTNMKEVKINEKDYIVNKTSQLPNEYQELEFIEGTGTQYINTEFYPHSGKYIIEAKIKTINVPTTATYYRVFGNLPSSNESKTAIYRLIYKGLNSNYNSPTIAPICGGQVKNEIPTTAWENNKEYTFIVNGINNTYTVNGVEATYQYVTPQYDNQTAIALFATATPTSYCNPMKYYYFRVTNENGELIRNMVPAKRKIDNEIGMYDTKTEQFYTKSGTGTFLKGPDVY